MLVASLPATRSRMPTTSPMPTIASSGACDSRDYKQGWIPRLFPIRIKAGPGRSLRSLTCSSSYELLHLSRLGECASESPEHVERTAAAARVATVPATTCNKKRYSAADKESRSLLQQLNLHPRKRGSIHERHRRFLKPLSVLAAPAHIPT